MQLLVIGASGRIGRSIVTEAVRRGHAVTGHSRAVARVPAGAQPLVSEPDDISALAAALPGHDAVIFALGADARSRPTIFSDATRALIRAMMQTGVRRLVAITGAGGRETCGFGGRLAARVLSPLFLRRRHPDKDVQEALIAGSDLDWTVVRPGPIAAGPLKGGLHALWPVPDNVQVCGITSSEIAEFALDVVEQHRWRQARPLVGHFA